MAKTGDAEELWWCNPVGLAHVVPHAAPRQSNVYLFNSDTDFDHRLEAAARWSELRTGRVGVGGGWRLYSSGPARDRNPSRIGGCRVPAEERSALLGPERSLVEIEQ